MAPPSESRPGLPKVEERDLLDMVFDDLLDPQSLKRWKQFAESNPELAREVIVRSIQDLRHMPSQPSSEEIRKFGINLVTFAVTALERAYAREQGVPPPETEMPPLPAA